MPSRRRPSDRQSFHFWTPGELVRVSAIAGFTLVPLSMAALSEGRTAQPTVQKSADMAQPGHLRSVRIVSFDFGKLSMSSMGDAEESHR